MADSKKYKQALTELKKELKLHREERLKALKDLYEVKACGLQSMDNWLKTGGICFVVALILGITHIFLDPEGFLSGWFWRVPLAILVVGFLCIVCSLCSND